MEYKPTRAYLLSKNFVHLVDSKHNVRWILEIKPYNQNPKYIIYRERYNTFWYWKHRYNIRSEEDFETMIRILSK